MKKIYGLLIFLGAVLLLGTAGASDAGTIDGSQIWLQVSISIVMIAIGYIGIKINASGSANTESAQKEMFKWIIPLKERICQYVSFKGRIEK